MTATMTKKAFRASILYIEIANFTAEGRRVKDAHSCMYLMHMTLTPFARANGVGVM